jgi:hypothetical protein
MNNRKIYFKISAAVVLAVMAQVSVASTECKTSIQRVFATTDGRMVADFDNAPETSFSMGQGQKNASAILLTAISSGLPVIVRWDASGVPCVNSGAQRTDAIGLWISR